MDTTSASILRFDSGMEDRITQLLVGKHPATVLTKGCVPAD